MKKAILKHGDSYDYSEVDYVHSQSKVTIICKIHGDFQQIPNAHLQGKGCKHCGNERHSNKLRKNTEIFIENALQKHGDTYDYAEVNYNKNCEKVIIICKKHGKFLQSPQSHLNGNGCKTCAIENKSNRRRSNTNEFIEKSKKIHGETYDYSKIEYISTKEYVTIICKKHGSFLQTPPSHLSGFGCPFCKNKTEWKLYENLKNVYSSLENQFKKEWCKRKNRLPFDFCIPEKKIIIELDGLQHFKQVSVWKPPEEQYKLDKFKEQCANTNGYSTIRLLQEDVFFNKYDWLTELCHSIDDISNSENITNIYLCKNNEYQYYL